MIICLLFKGTAIDLFDRYQDVENFILRGKSKMSVDEVAILNKNQIVTSHEDGVIRVWDSKTGLKNIKQNNKNTTKHVRTSLPKLSLALFLSLYFISSSLSSSWASSLFSFTVSLKTIFTNIKN